MKIQKTPSEIDFLKESDKLKTILRQSLIHDKSRRENTAEHSWQLALAVMALQSYCDFPFQMERALKMALVHDLVEIDAGDTFVYDNKANEDKFQRELKAAERLFAFLPEQGEELKNLWLAYEKQDCSESKYVYALDRFLPLFANYMTGGHSWRVNNVKAHQVLSKNAAIEKASVRLWAIAKQMVEEAVARGDLATS